MKTANDLSTAPIPASVERPLVLGLLPKTTGSSRLHVTMPVKLLIKIPGLKLITFPFSCLSKPQRRILLVGIASATVGSQKPAPLF